MSATVKRLPLKELETWKAKAKALDATVEWLEGRIDSEKLITVGRMLKSWECAGTEKER